MAAARHEASARVATTLAGPLPDVTDHFFGGTLAVGTERRDAWEIYRDDDSSITLIETTRDGATSTRTGTSIQASTFAEAEAILIAAVHPRTVRRALFTAFAVMAAREPRTRVRR